MLAAELECADEGRGRIVVAGFEAEHEDRARAVAAAGEERLVVVQEPAVARVQARLGDRAGCLDGALEVGEGHGGAGRNEGRRLKPHPGLGDHAQRALRAAEQPVRRRSGA